MAGRRTDGRAAATAATTALDAQGVEYRLHPYEPGAHIDGYGLEAASLLGVPASRIFKTLMIDVGGTLAVAVVPVAGMLDLRAAAAALGAKRATMAEPAAAERRTGYVLGGISPIGQRMRSTTVLDASVSDFETVFVSAGRRGLQVELSPADLVRMTDARVASITR